MDHGRPPSIILETPPGTPDAERRNTISDSPFGTSNIAETSKDPKRTKKSKKELEIVVSFQRKESHAEFIY